MGVKTAIKKSLTFGFKPTRWIGLEQVKSNGKICTDLVKDLLVKETDPKRVQEKKEAEAQERRLTPADLQSRKRIALFLIMAYTLIGLGCFAYMGYWWFVKALILQGLVSLIMGLLMLVYILRELLVFYQIRYQRHRLTLQALLQLWFHTGKTKRKKNKK